MHSRTTLNNHKSTHNSKIKIFLFSPFLFHLFGKSRTEVLGGGKKNKKREKKPKNVIKEIKKGNFRVLFTYIHKIISSLSAAPVSCGEWSFFLCFLLSWIAVLLLNCLRRAMWFGRAQIFISNLLENRFFDFEATFGKIAVFSLEILAGDAGKKLEATSDGVFCASCCSYS